MATVRHAPLLDRLCHLDSAASPADRELLERFAAGDEEAFARLVERHGPMVWRICRGALRQHCDAEDAYQAVFLVLARKAASISWRDSVAAWLHAVAVRVTRKARATTRKMSPPSEAAGEAADPLDEMTARELLAALDEELAGLPEKYRGPLLLCCLEGRTQEETARALGWSHSTVRRRLTSGRELLHARLVRRGLTLSAALGASLVARASAACPAGIPSVATASTHAAGLACAVLGPALWLRAACALLTALVIGTLAVTLTPAAAPLAVEAAPPDDKPVARTDAVGDPLPDGALFRLGTLRLRHKNTTLAVAFAPDGKTLVAGGWDSRLRLWDPVTGRELRQIETPENGVYSLAYSPDGKLLAGGCTVGVVCLWDAASGEEVRRLRDHKGEVRGLAFSADGMRLATGDTAAVRLWDPRTGKLLHTWTGADSCSLAFSPDGTLLASGGRDCIVRVWEIASGKKLHELRGRHDNGVQSVVFAPDGKVVVSSSSNRVLCWDVATGKKIEGILPSARGDCVRFSPDGKSLAADSQEREIRDIRLWDWPSGKEKSKLSGPADHLHSLAFSPDGKQLAVASSESAVHLYDLDTGKRLTYGPGHQERLVSVDCSPDGKLIATAAWDGTVRLWDAQTGKERQTIAADRGGSRTWYCEAARLGHVAFSVDSKLLAITRGDETALVWDIASGKEVHRFRGNSLAFSPDGKLVACGGRGTDGPEANMGVIRLHDAESGKLLRELRGHKTMLAGLMFTPDGKSIISRGIRLEGLSTGEPGESETEFVRFWDVASGKQRRGWQWSDHGQALAPDGRRLVGFPMIGKTLALQEIATGQKCLDIDPKQGLLFSVAFSPDGRTLATGGEDGTVALWDLPSGKELSRLAGHRGWALSLAFSPDGRTLVSGSLDTTALVWDVARITQRPRKAAEPSAQELDAAWQKLGGDAAAAYAATTVLATDRALPLLRERLQPAAEPDAKQVGRLLADLDSNDFATRQKAAKELENLGELVAPALRKALAGRPSAEMKRQLELLLEALDGVTLSGEQLRGTRAVEALEMNASAEAKTVLEKLAAGVPGAMLTREAKAALERWRRR
jgi:RNA polymerase sigma factor (sigma-70 family)